ncbi:MAG: hypothetical protein KAJ49_07730, partial [Arcobacteraceae bacterium]|nr:hypothetical protein [Arcobacteraceae bacterium]
NPISNKKEYKLSNSSKAMIGIEFGYLNFTSSTKHIDKVNNEERTINSKGKGQDISFVYNFKNSNFMWKLGMINFSEEPIANSTEMNYSETLWSPKSESITHIEIGYNHNFNKKEGFYPSIFGDIGFYSYQYQNKNLENYADSITGVMYMDDFNGNTFNKYTQPSDMETASGLFIDLGASLNYETKKYRFQVLGKLNTMKVKKYEGIYSVNSSYYGGATATKMHGYEHEITIEPSINFSIAYKL